MNCVRQSSTWIGNWADRGFCHFDFLGRPFLGALYLGWHDLKLAEKCKELIHHSWPGGILDFAKIWNRNQNSLATSFQCRGLTHTPGRWKMWKFWPVLAKTFLLSLLCAPVSMPASCFYCAGVSLYNLLYCCCCVVYVLNTPTWQLKEDAEL